MKKIYDEYFKIDDLKPISNRVFLNRILLSLSAIILCLSMTCMSAFAYFSYTISSKNNTIVSAAYSLSVKNKEGITVQNGVFKLDNQNSSSRDYHFIVTPSQNSTASVGFARILINGKAYFTQPIGDEAPGIASSRAFTIHVPAGTSYTVQFIAEWGSCSKPTITFGGDVISEISLGDYSAAQIILDEEENEEEQEDGIIDQENEEDIIDQENNEEDDLEDEVVDDETTDNSNNQQDEQNSNQENSDNQQDEQNSSQENSNEQDSSNQEQETDDSNQSDEDTDNDNQNIEDELTNIQ